MDGQTVGHKYVDSCELINEPPDNDLSLVESHAKLSCVFNLSCSIDIYITHTHTYTHINGKTLDYLRRPKHLLKLLATIQTMRCLPSEIFMQNA